MHAKYEKADLQAVVGINCSHLSSAQQKKFLEVLTEFEDLLDGTLGDWKTEPFPFELKEGPKPYYGRLYPVAKVHKDTVTEE